MSNMFRIGHGYDVHRLVDGRPLILGGVAIPFEQGLAGHSDADVLLHAVMDAVLGAVGLKDIGRHFPDNDAYYENSSSLVLLDKVYNLITKAGWQIENIDATIVAEAPKLSPYCANMAANIAKTLRAFPDTVNIKATTEEGLGFTGQGLGMAAHAVCLLKDW